MAFGDPAEVLTTAWLEAALDGVRGDARLVDLQTKTVGTGQMADSTRCTLTWDRETDAPASVVAKLPSADESSRNASRLTRCYEIETAWYAELAPSMPVRAPRCLKVDYDAEEDSFDLLLEDLAPAEQGDQLAGCSLEQAHTAVAELPKLHAPRYGDPALEQLPWLHRYTEENAANMGALIAMMFPGFCERYDGRIDADIVAMGEAFVGKAATYTSRGDEPWSVQHGDYRLDNLLFATEAGGAPVAVVDWQTVSHGPPTSDLSYFIGAGLLPDDRRAHERELVEAYRDGMAALGVDISFDDLWTRYRRHTVAGFLMAVVASMLVKQTDRGDEMFVAMAQRHGRHALDLDALELLG